MSYQPTPTKREGQDDYVVITNEDLRTVIDVLERLQKQLAHMTGINFDPGQGGL